MDTKTAVTAETETGQRREILHIPPPLLRCRQAGLRER